MDLDLGNMDLDMGNMDLDLRNMDLDMGKMALDLDMGKMNLDLLWTPFALWPSKRWVCICMSVRLGVCARARAWGNKNSLHE